MFGNVNIVGLEYLVLCAHIRQNIGWAIYRGLQNSLKKA